MLEHDWSNKFEAVRADNKAHSRKNGDVDIMYYAGAARYQEVYVKFYLKLFFVGVLEYFGNIFIF